MMDAKEFLAACGGDYEGTMRRLMGNEMLFYRLLPKVFVDENFAKSGGCADSGRSGCGI